MSYVVCMQLLFSYITDQFIMWTKDLVMSHIYTIIMPQNWEIRERWFKSYFYYLLS